ncbi:hypothetical protein [Deinococcus hopiensis]|uniref:hypothetical protein n=1 Tax=Deinococcus hopiensis TaxID=309885 RepID=UPI00111C3631|nr:hypothetical protein [Deinococcus hopiensis]
MNSKKRVLHDERLGVGSVDGTHLTLEGREKGLENISGSLEEAKARREIRERDGAFRALLVERCPEIWKRLA